VQAIGPGGASAFSETGSLTLADYDGDDDGDALRNGWELHGYDADGNGSIDVDLPGMGADYRHKDIFVEMDYMVRGSASNGLGPNAFVLSEIEDVFDAAPVTNPDGVTGIHIHLDLDDLVPYDADLNPYVTEFNALKAAHFTAARAATHHYMIWANGYGGSSSSGVSMGIPATDFIVTLGLWNGNAGGTDYEKIGTFIHELGHNLNLTHGGNDHVNYKANYLSVMNYFYQTSGVYRDGSWHNFDYQRVTLPSLNENNLSEPAGLGAAATGYGVVWFCYAAPNYYAVIDYTAQSSVNWNCSGTAFETGVQANINADGFYNTLGTQNNWQNIVYNGGGVIGSGLSPQALLQQIEDSFVDLKMEELTYEENQTIQSILNAQPQP